MALQNITTKEVQLAQELTLAELDQVAGGKHRHHVKKGADDFGGTSAAGASVAKAPAGASASNDSHEVEKETETENHRRRGRDG